ncbi:hypothetical protein GCM10023080_046960 [Streptomyces pseudoechinosporeus]
MSPPATAATGTRSGARGCFSGDCVCLEWHWHGATPENFMAHLAMWEGIGKSDGSETEWGDHVTDAEYNSRK